MLTVCLNIPQIIETVYTTGNKTERDKHNQRGPEIVRLQQVITEENRRKDKGVLEPLQGPEQLNVILHLVRIFGYKGTQSYRLNQIVLIKITREAQSSSFGALLQFN